MRDIAELFARLQLRPDANERDVRRAYARELKQIDQEQQAQAFQELRETYDQLLWWVRQQQMQDATAPEADAQDAASLASASGAGDAKPPEALSVPPPVSSEPEHEALPSSEALGREMLDLLVQHLTENKLRDRQAAAALLRQCLDDPRLGSVDAATYFEWGVASILAGGWAPGHEFLFSPAIEGFGWREDRSRLLWFGRPGQIVDAAINELLAFDTQPSEHRALQKEAIRKLRASEPLPTGELLRELPIAEHVVAAFPNWMHVISRSESLLDWRRRHGEVPTWRKKIANRPRLRLVRPPSSTAPAAGKSRNWGMVFLIFMLVSALGRLLAGLAQDPSPHPRDVTGPTTLASVHRPSQQEAELRQRAQAALGNTATSPDAQLVAVRAQTRASELAHAMPAAASCRAVATHARDHALAHARGAFSAAFDRLLLDCFVKNLGAVSDDMADVAMENDRQRRRADAPAVHSRSYGEKIALAVRQHIDHMEASRIPGNPSAEFDVRLAADGAIQSVSLKKTSGHHAWDESARRALLRTRSFPLDVNGKVPAQMVINMRPR